MSFRTALDVDPGGETHTVDVCIIGSGAGGSVLAAGLAAQGRSVLVLEAGKYWTKEQATLQERDSMPGLYQEAGGRSTADGAITVLQGRSVGGSTTVNWTSCFRTPPKVLAHWQAVHGLDALTEEALRPHFEAVEQRLSIQEWPKAAANANNQVLFDGAEKLGWETGPMRRNVKGCANSGYCGMGCPVDGKQAMHLTYLADAVADGAIVQAEAPVQRLIHDGRRVTGVVARIQPHGTGLAGGPEVRVTAKVVVVSGGAINSPALLLASGIRPELPIGHRTFIHPVVAVFGAYEHDIHPWYGAPQTSHSHHHIDRGPGKMGFFLETAPLHPMLAGTGIKLFGRAHSDLMRRLRQTSALLALHVDGFVPEDVGGVVSLDGHGRPKLDYPFRAPLLEALPASHKALVQVHLAAGATMIGTGHPDPPVLRTEADLSKLETLKYGALEHAMFTAHQMGGCTMGPDPATSVVGLDHRVHGMDNLFVVDGSVLPTSLGVNPSETVYGLAHRARAFVAAAV